MEAPLTTSASPRLAERQRPDLLPRALLPSAAARRTRTKRLLALLALTALAVPQLAAAAPIPVRVRVLKGSREGPAAVDPRLADLQHQLGKLAYVKWEQVAEQQVSMELGKSASVPLPEGATLELTLVDARKDTVTFDVKVAARKTHSRLTIAKDQRIVHQVAGEKDGAAYFASIRPWP